MKKLMKKKNNKGFSLVELIVVVLILGILAVALAPQVMKWVGKARTNADENSKKDIKSAIQVAVADLQADGDTITFTSGSLSFVYSESGVNGLSSANPKLQAKIKEVTGEDYSTKPSDGGTFTVTISDKYVVSVDVTPTTP